MGWLMNFLEKFKIIESEDYGEEAEPGIHVNDLLEWLIKEKQNLISKHQLEEKVNNYTHKLKEKRWILECKVDEFEKSLGERKEMFAPFLSESRKILESMTPEKKTVESTISMNIRLENVEKILRLIEENSIEDKEILTSLLNEFLDLQRHKEGFDETISQSGFSKMQTLFNKATELGQSMENLRNSREEINVRKAHLSKIKVKLEEKEAELYTLQQREHYAKFKEIREERLSLQKELEACIDFKEKFDIKHKLDLVEKKVGDKDYLFRIDEAQYRVDHFLEQFNKQEQEIKDLLEKIENGMARRDREIDMFVNLVKIGLEKEIMVRS